jgi:hypothetical protein
MTACHMTGTFLKCITLVCLTLKVPLVVMIIRTDSYDSFQKWKPLTVPRLSNSRPWKAGGMSLVILQTEE